MDPCQFAAARQRSHELWQKWYKTRDQKVYQEYQAARAEIHKQIDNSKTDEPLSAELSRNRTLNKGAAIQEETDQRQFATVRSRFSGHWKVTVTRRRVDELWQEWSETRDKTVYAEWKEAFGQLLMEIKSGANARLQSQNGIPRMAVTPQGSVAENSPATPKEQERVEGANTAAKTPPPNPYITPNILQRIIMSKYKARNKIAGEALSAPPSPAPEVEWELQASERDREVALSLKLPPNFYAMKEAHRVDVITLE